MMPVNANCPGVNSSGAGIQSACSGCPNQNICAQPKKADDSKASVEMSMKDIKGKLLILSGKGGVGKSTMTMLLSRYMAYLRPKKYFGILDIDVCGPSQPRLLGVLEENVHQSGFGWSPVAVDDHICVMSIGFLVNSSDDAVIWRGPKKNGMIKQFLTEVDWGHLDMLLLDTPPGTSDEHLTVVSYLRNESESLRAVIVSTPQEISLLDVRKQINFCKKQNIPIVGVVENMSSFLCGHCGNSSEIFPSSTGGVALMCKDMGVPFLGSIPLDYEVTKSCDLGEDLDNINNVTKKALVDISENILKTFNM